MIYDFGKNSATTAQIASVIAQTDRSRRLLDRVLFWTNYASVYRWGKTWIAKSRPEWAAETCMTDVQIKKALADLRGELLIETRQALFGGKNITHLTLTEKTEQVVSALLTVSREADGWTEFTMGRVPLVRRQVEQALIRPKNAISILRKPSTPQHSPESATEASGGSQSKDSANQSLMNAMAKSHKMFGSQTQPNMQQVPKGSVIGQLKKLKDKPLPGGDNLYPNFSLQDYIKEFMNSPPASDDVQIKFLDDDAGLEQPLWVGVDLAQKEGMSAPPISWKKHELKPKFITDKQTFPKMLKAPEIYAGMIVQIADSIPPGQAYLVNPDGSCALVKGTTQGVPNGATQGEPYGATQVVPQGCHSYKEDLMKTEGKQEMGLTPDPADLTGDQTEGDPDMPEIKGKLSEGLKQALEKADAKKKINTAKKLKSGDLLKQMEEVWRETHESYYGLALGPLTVEKKTRLKLISSKLHGLGITQDEREQILEWFVVNWSSVAEHVKQSMGHSKAPMVPDLGYLLKNIDLAVSLYKEAWATDSEPVQTIAPAKHDPFADMGTGLDTGLDKEQAQDTEPEDDPEEDPEEYLSPLMKAALKAKGEL